MILFFQNGRLGNQILQYYGLKKYFSSHKLIIFGCNELKNLFDNIEYNFFIKSNYSSDKIRFNILKFFFFF